MNNRAQVTPFTVFFWLVITLICWFMFLAKFVSEWGQQAIISNNLVGFEAFILGNLNLIILVVLGIAVTSYMFIGSSR